MGVKARIVGVALGAFLVLTGCDSYSILDQFKKDGEDTTKTVSDQKTDPVTPPERLTLTVEKTTVVPSGSVALYPVGGTKPYRFQVFGTDLYAGTKDRVPFGTFDDSAFTAGTAIGVLTIRVVDAAEKTAEAAITVIPPTPTYAGITRSFTDKTVTLAWSYSDSSIIDNFLIRRSTDGITYADHAQPAKTATSYTDDTPSGPTTYRYELIAVAGAFKSAPVMYIAQGN